MRGVLIRKLLIAASMKRRKLIQLISSPLPHHLTLTTALTPRWRKAPLVQLVPSLKRALRPSSRPFLWLISIKVQLCPNLMQLRRPQDGRETLVMLKASPKADPRETNVNAIVEYV